MLYYVGEKPGLSQVRRNIYAGVYWDRGAKNDIWD